MYIAAYYIFSYDVQMDAAQPVIGSIETYTTGGRNLATVQKGIEKSRSCTRTHTHTHTHTITQIQTHTYTQ